MIIRDDQLYEVNLADHHYLVPGSMLSAIETIVQRVAHTSDMSAPVHLTHVGQKVIAVIKEVRALLGLHLRDSKMLVDKVRAGQRVQLGVFPWHEIPTINANFKAAGAQLSFPGPLEMLAREAK
jgi:ribosomal protein L7/L12